MYDSIHTSYILIIILVVSAGVYATHKRTSTSADGSGRMSSSQRYDKPQAYVAAIADWSNRMPYVGVWRTPRSAAGRRSPDLWDSGSLANKSDYQALRCAELHGTVNAYAHLVGCCT